MSYPSTVLWGAANPVFHHPASGGSFEPSTHPDASIRFVPERFDGGSPSIILDSGRIYTRADGWRAYVSFTWKYLSASNARSLADQLNSMLTRGPNYIMIQPHKEVAITFRMVLECDFNPGHTGGLYYGHELTLNFKSIEIYPQIPLQSGNGTITAGNFSPQIY